MRVVLAVLAATLASWAQPTIAQTTQPDPAAGSADEIIIADYRIGSAWRLPVLDLAETQLQHPSWGYRHAERNYFLAADLARAEGLTVDDDVLYAAAMLHDWGGLAPYEVEGAPHQIRSVELAEPFLRDAGFPMQKWPAVRDAILGHIPSGEPTTPEGIVLHDADLLDFLGAEGIARLLAATGDEPSMDQSLSWIEGLAAALPQRLITAEARRIAEPRVAYMSGFLAQLRSELPPGTRP